MRCARQPVCRLCNPVTRDVQIGRCCLRLYDKLVMVWCSFRRLDKLLMRVSSLRRHHKLLFLSCRLAGQLLHAQAWAAGGQTQRALEAAIGSFREARAAAQPVQPQKSWFVEPDKQG